MIEPGTPYCFGEAAGLADICLIPQLYNAHRWGCDLSGFARLTDIEARCLDPSLTLPRLRLKVGEVSGSIPL